MLFLHCKTTITIRSGMKEYLFLKKLSFTFADFFCMQELTFWLNFVSNITITKLELLAGKCLPVYREYLTVMDLFMLFMKFLIKLWWIIIGKRRDVETGLSIWEMFTCLREYLTVSDHFCFLVIFLFYGFFSRAKENCIVLTKFCRIQSKTMKFRKCRLAHFNPISL